MEHQHHKPDRRTTKVMATTVVTGIRTASAAVKVWRMSASAALLLAALPVGATKDDSSDHAAASAVERIHVLRSVREERTTDPVFCSAARIGFTPGVFADRFSFWSVTVRAADGRISNALVRETGDIRTCFGATADPLVINFYGEGQIGGIAFAGSGDCKLIHANFPETGLSTFRCFLALGQLPAPYTGGLLTTNTMVSRAVLGAETDPSGYVQSSIATVRLWRQ